jgi:hypothetical protein
MFYSQSRSSDHCGFVTLTMNLGFVIHSELGSITIFSDRKAGFAAFSTAGLDGSTSYDLTEKQKNI